MPQLALARPSFLLRLLVLTCAVALLTLAAPSSAEAHRKHPRIQQAVSIAYAQISDPYVYGNAGPYSFDCSGLISYAYTSAGRYLPRSTDSQWQYVRKIPKSKLRPGDLMFFLSGGDPYHVGMFAGWENGQAQILRASSTLGQVTVGPVWTSDWYAGTLRHRNLG